MYFSHSRRSFLLAWQSRRPINLYKQTGRRVVCRLAFAALRNFEMSCSRHRSQNRRCGGIAVIAYVSEAIQSSCRVGKANGSRECAPDDKLRVPTILFREVVMVGTAQARLCPPYELCCSFVTDPSAPDPLCQSRNEAVGIGLVVENVGRDAHAAKTRGDVDAFSCQSLDQACRHPILKAMVLEAEAQDMRRPKATLRRADADAAQALRDPFCQHQETLHHGRCAPFGHHFHPDRGHLHRNEMVALAHVEAPCIGNVADIGEIDRILGAHVTAAERGLLKRYAAL